MKCLEIHIMLLKKMISHDQVEVTEFMMLMLELERRGID